MTTEAIAEPGAPRSRRGQRLYQERVLTPLEQIPTLPSTDAGYANGAWAYYLRPDGETIAEILLLYPNGGVPDVDNPKMRERFGLNAEYYQNRQARKGFEYIGPVLTEAGVKRLVEILAANREDAILFCEDEIANARHAAQNSDRPEVRDRERKRASQFERRLEYLKQPLVEADLLKELQDIARAQMLANVDPNVIKVMRAMIGEVNANLENAVAHFQQGRRNADDKVKRSGGRGADASDFQGVDHLDD